MVPARQVRRGRRAHQRRAPAVRVEDHRDGEVLPRVRLRLVTAAEQVLEHALAREPSLGGTRLICIDGPSGSGKSTLAREVARLTESATVHTDDLCPGWDGVPELPGILAALLAPLASGESGRHPRYDWILGHLVEDLVVPALPVVLLEGVGAGACRLAPVTTTLVWVDADVSVRKERALTRDGDTFRDHWDPWAAAEQTYFEAEQVRARADLVITT
ncbi:MAG: 4-amino-4-deoxy-L-arabinose transferase [Microbacterium sp.]|nr:MAG: 4-amino-4-deoxy-L-arabinose transferase [Microbacterium sp.]